MTQAKKNTKPRPSEAPSAPRGLGGYCWAEHPDRHVHCVEPVGHETRHRDHWHPYTGTRWT